VASCGVNAAVRRGPKYHSGSGSMSKHCRAPNSSRGFSHGKEVPAAESPHPPESLTGIRPLKRAWTEAYRCLPENQAQTPQLKRVRAITANGSAGSQMGMSCISRRSPRLGAVSARYPETDGNRCSRCWASARARCAQPNKPRLHASTPRAPSRASCNRALPRRPDALA
jgi:hypothetical protein